MSRSAESRLDKLYLRKHAEFTLGKLIKLLPVDADLADREISDSLNHCQPVSGLGNLSDNALVIELLAFGAQSGSFHLLLHQANRLLGLLRLHKVPFLMSRNTLYI
jgi:hypothetical protein